VWVRVALVWVAALAAGACGASSGGSADVPGASEVSGVDAADAEALPDGRADAAGEASEAGDGAGGGDAWDVGPQPVDWHLPALVSCAAGGDACQAPVAGAAVGSRRADFFYPYDLYPEASIPDPTGVRVQIAARSAAPGALTKVELLGHDLSLLALPAPDGDTPQAVRDLLAAQDVHWLHVWPLTLTPGQPFFVTFHADAAALADGVDVPLRVETAEGVALDEQGPVSAPAVRLTYVTTSEDFGTLLVHAHNTDAAVHTLTALEVNGHDLTAAACVPAATLQPGQAALWTVPLCQPLAIGQAWTVVARFADAPPAVGAGRVILPHFAIEGWVAGDECPFPGANEANYQAHRDAGFDMLFLRSDYSSKEGCNGATAGSILEASLAIPDVYFMLDEWAPPEGLDLARQVRLLGDEVDADYPPDKPWRVSQRAKRSWTTYPGLTTYVGGSRHRHNGAFAGTADIQGFDIYNAACAPKILDGGHWPSLRAPYDFCRAVRANHMPNPQWFYSQGLHGGWNLDTDPPTLRQPDAAELKVQAMSVALCGSKGLMYFQSDLGLAAQLPNTWQAITDVNRDIGALRGLLREGDTIGGVRASVEGVLVDAIRARDAIVVPVLNVTAAIEMKEVRCFTEHDPHWELASVSTDVTFTVPDDFAVVDLLELVDGELLPVQEGVFAWERAITVPGVSLSAARPYRLYVAARTPDVADRIRATLAR